MKVTVRIHTLAGLKLKKVRVSADGKRLLIRRETKKTYGWEPEIGTMEVRRKFLDRSAYFTDIFPDADKSWTINPNLSQLETPKWDKRQSKKYIEAKLIEKTGMEPKEKGAGAILWIIAIIGIANIVATVILSGRVRIG